MPASHRQTAVWIAATALAATVPLARLILTTLLRSLWLIQAKSESGVVEMKLSQLPAVPVPEAPAAPRVGRPRKPKGLVILSGLLRTQERMVKAAYLSRGFKVVTRIHRDAWATLVLQRP